MNITALKQKKLHTEVKWNNPTSENLSIAQTNLVWIPSVSNDNDNHNHTLTCYSYTPISSKSISINPTKTPTAEVDIGSYIHN